MATKLTVTRIPKLNVVVIRQHGGNFFVATRDAIVIDLFGLSALLKYMLVSGIISKRMLEGILEEYDSYAADSRYNGSGK